MLFCAFCCSHSLLQSGGSLASIITAVSPSLSLAHSHKQLPCSLAQSLVLYLIDTVCAPCSLAPPPSLISPFLSLVRHHQNINIFNVLQRAAVGITRCCKSLAHLVVCVACNVCECESESSQAVVCNACTT